MTPSVRLPADWRVAPTDPLLERDFARPDLDDSAWETVTVPGHWRSTPAFAASEAASRQAPTAMKARSTPNQVFSHMAWANTVSKDCSAPGSSSAMLSGSPAR